MTDTQRVNLSRAMGPRQLIMSWKSVLRTMTVVVVVMMVVVGAVEGRATSLEIPCQDFSNNINIGCLCSLNEVNATRINCDNVVFPGDFPVLPYRYNSFTLLEKKGNVAGKPRY